MLMPSAGAMACPLLAVGRIVLALAIFASAGAAFAQEIEVTDRQGNGYELRIVLPRTTSLEIAQDALWPRAQQICADRVAKYGKYRFEATSPLDGIGIAGDQAERMVLVQSLDCVEYAAIHEQEPVAFVPAPSTPPTSADESAVRDLSLHYLSVVDEGRFEEAFAMMASSFQPFMAEGNWRETRAAFNSGIDSEVVRQVVRLTWYDDPAGAPTPGRYVAADYRGDMANGAFYCGYLVWLLQADGSYRLVRSEEGMLSRDEVHRIPSAMRATVRTQLQCRD